MAKATYTLPNGTVVHIDGTIEEIQALSTFYGATSAASATGTTGAQVKAKAVPPKTKTKADLGQDGNALDIMAIVNEIKSCEEADLIDANILDGKDLVAKVLIPMFIVHKYFDNAYGLTSGHILKIGVQLGIKLDQGNTSRCLSGAAKAFVMADKVRKKGQATGYKLSRRGIAHIESLLNKGD